MTSSITDQPGEHIDPEDDTSLPELTTAEQADLQAFVDDEAVRAAQAELPPVEIAASVVVAESDVLDNLTSLTETDDPAIGPLTLKEAYGESVGRALEWSADAQLCAVYSGGDDEESYVDEDGLSPCWSFTYRNSGGQYLDLIIVNGQLQVSDLTFSGTPGAAFTLDDLLDSPDIIALAREQGIEGTALTLNLEQGETGMLRALIISGDQQVVIDPITND